MTDGVAWIEDDFLNWYKMKYDSDPRELTPDKQSKAWDEYYEYSKPRGR